MSSKKNVQSGSVSENSQKFSAGLPYADNISIILLTAAVNVLCIFIFYYGRDIDLKGVLTDSLFCGVITSFADVYILVPRIEAMRRNGALPSVVPVSAFAMKLPKNKFMLASFLAVIFGILTPLANFILIKFYGITYFGFPQLVFWKAVYSSLLSAKIIEFTILRFVQPDCAAPSDSEQRGSSVVKNQLPRISVFKEWFNTVTDDFGFNMLVGLLSGGTIIEGYNVIIAPLASSGVGITAIILGLIVTARMAYPIAKNIKAQAESAGCCAKNTAQRGGVFRLPSEPWKFALVLTMPIILLSFAAFWSVMAFFGFGQLNFSNFS